MSFNYNKNYKTKYFVIQKYFVYFVIRIAEEENINIDIKNISLNFLYTNISSFTAI